MPTRDEEAEQWRLISLNSRKAAQHLLMTDCYRSSVSRAYYAAYSALTAALIRQGIALGHGGNNPGHAGLPVLVVNNLTSLPLTARYDLNKALRRLYRARVEADYAGRSGLRGGCCRGQRGCETINTRPCPRFSDSRIGICRIGTLRRKLTWQQ